MKAMLGLILSLLLFGTASISQTDGSWQNTNIGGIHYAVPRHSLEPGYWQDSLQHTYDCTDPCTVQFDDRVTAIYLRYKWMQLNPQKGVYDFSDLGAVIDRIHASGKLVTLEIMAGKYTPAWVFDEGAHHIATLANDGDDFSQPLVPLPWDPVFLAAHKDLINALTTFLHQTPGRYETVALLKNGSLVIHSGELRLMPADAFQSSPGKGDDSAKDSFRKDLCDDWAQSGYTEAKLLAAFKTTNEQIDAAFPDKYLGMAFVAGSAEFPTVKSGTCTYPKKNKTFELLIQQMVSTYGPRAIINSTVLTQDAGNPPIMKWVLANGGKIAFQLNQQAVGCQENSGNPCNLKSFEGAIQAGIDAGATFIEVHDGNINRYKDILPKYSGLLAKQ